MAEALDTAWVVWAMDMAGKKKAEEGLPQRRDYFNVIPRIVLAPRISRLSNRFAAVAPH